MHEQTDRLRDQARQVSTIANRYRAEIDPAGNPDRNDLLRQIGEALDRKASQLTELVDLITKAAAQG